jgi:hypothetical protein
MCTRPHSQIPVASVALHKILSRHLPYLAGELQFEQCCKRFRSRHLGLQILDDFIDVGGFVGFQQAQDSLFVRREPFFRE